VYATLTTTKGTTEAMLETAAVVGEALHGWLGDIDGFEGMVLLCNEETGVTHLLSLWASQAVAERHEHARRQFRDRVTATVDVEVQGTHGYDVAFARPPAAHGRPAPRYASMTTTKGAVDDTLATAQMVAEAMFDWLSEMDGFEALFMLADLPTETTHVISLWESEEVAERQRHARLQFRDRITATVDVEVQETAGYDVGFMRLKEV
jgi:heme-degrading monooxygenase HmoA